MKTLKLNVGCGADYRLGFINIDASNLLFKVDKIIDLTTETLTNYFEHNSASYILVNDFIEHHYHWDALRLLTDFFYILVSGGYCEIRVPDCEVIIKSWRYSVEEKLTLLYGGQDIGQGGPMDMELSRKNYPHLFCHKYGWTRKRMKEDLMRIGFKQVTFKSMGTNFVVLAQK